jgi:ketosteroid isomerase-like protein
MADNTLHDILEAGKASSPHAFSEAMPGAAHAEDQFFDALAAGDAARVERLLEEGFLIVDVLSGGVSDKATLVAALRTRLLRIERLRVVERVARRYGDTAVIVGRTQMEGSFDAGAFTVASRYTHVLVRQPDRRWLLASAQGTRIVEP